VQSRLVHTTLSRTQDLEQAYLCVSAPRKSRKVIVTKSHATINAADPVVQAWEVVNESATYSAATPAHQHHLPTAHWTAGAM
jgi:hypothetical protein